jgi:protein-S-isoprenylcysteine O-methyltransferase Ste14
MISRVLLWSVVLLFPVGEIALAVMRRARSRIVRHADEGSTGLLWLVILCGVGTAIGSQWIPGLRLPGPGWVLRGLALVLLTSGLAVRWVAVVSLGRFFTVDVAIHEQHALVDKGVYRYVRHPSYTGLLTAFAGLGVFFGNWVGLCALTVPVGLAVLMRIRREEAALLEGLGASYAAYCSRTKRLLPGVY